MDSVPQKDVLDNEVFIFDNLDGMSISDKPIMLDMPLFGVCISGDATESQSQRVSCAGQQPVYSDARPYFAWL